MAAFREESYKVLITKFRVISDLDFFQYTETHQVVDFGIIHDQRSNLRHAMVSAAASCDVVVSSGGVRNFLLGQPLVSLTICNPYFICSCC